MRNCHIGHFLVMVVLLILMNMCFPKESGDHMHIRRINHRSQAMVIEESDEHRDIVSQISAHDACPTSHSMAVDR